MENNREIKIKGIGSLDLPVDLIEIEFTLEEMNKDYKKGNESFNNSILELQNIVQSIGFNSSDLKTSDIRVTTEYDSRKKGGSYVDVFKGYNFKTEMILSFDLDSQKLGEVFTAVANSKAGPKIEVNFTVKDIQSIKTKLLANAAIDAKNKATILCEAAGAKLGKLININYNWRNLNYYSSTKYRIGDFEEESTEHLCYSRLELPSEQKWTFTPENISIEDDAYFIWEIID